MAIPEWVTNAPQYELGIDYDIANQYKFDLTGYYKDGNNEATVITGVYAATYNTTKALMVSNSGYSDVRGVEMSLVRICADRSISMQVAIFLVCQRRSGFQSALRTGFDLIDVPKTLRSGESIWNNFTKLN